MSQTIDVNGQSINYPETGDTNWGDEATDFAVQTSAAFGKLGLASGTSVDIAQTLDVTGNTTLDANLSVAGTTSLTGNVTLTNNLTVNGNTALGNASGDSLTINSNGVSIPNGLNFDSNTLVIDATNNRVGINDTTPSEALDVTGNALISGTLGITGNFAINTNKFNVTASSGNTTIAGTLGISNGTVSSPSLTPSSDTNTGMYSIGADKIGFAANGSRVGEFGNGYGGFTGNIIQVTSGQLTARQTTTSSSFVATGLSATITPRYVNSRILVLVNLYIGAGTNSGIVWSLIRNNTTYIAQSTGATTSNATGGYYTDIAANAGGTWIGTTASFIDSPATTSLTTYGVNYRSPAGTSIAIGGRASANDYGGYSSIILMEIQS